MKKALTFLTAIGLFLAVSAQITHPVKWTYAAKRVSDKEAIIFFKATIQDTWHIYSLVGKDGGPTKTSFKFSANKDFSPVGKPTEPKPLTRYESTIKMNVSYFEKEVVFQQKIKLNTNNKLAINGRLEYGLHQYPLQSTGRCRF